ncbi:TonB-dependent siderophore receptor [Herbaspirillum sp. RV1423]|uniref:TonB-dependent receptor n=1 Tax=Herbaspirillum sp. RV1423 TaxID=1443993 RepID=UPI0004BBDA96|nr:TonB-dependent siderophore receptor [Herbaspirillum sp. RV1423]
MQYRLTPIATALAVAFIVPLACSHTAKAQTTTGKDAKADQALPSITVNASADASANGLPEAYAGGQVARGGRVGFLGNQDFLDTPFSSTSYTQDLIKDQQAHSVGEVLLNDPSIRVTRGFGNYQEAYMIRGFMANSDDLAYNGLYGLLPRQYVASEMLERVEVFRGASAFLNGAAPGDGGIGGTINLLPKRASSDPITQATMGYETGGQVYFATDIGRRFGPDDRLGIRVNAVRREGGTAVNGENRELGMLTVGLDYRGNSFRLSADVGYQEHNLKNPRPSVRVAAGLAVPSAPSAATNFGQPWLYSNERDVFGTLRGEWDLSDSVTAWAALGTRYGTERNVLAGPTVTDTAGDTTANRFDNARRDTVRTGEAGIRGKFKTGVISHAVSATASSYWQDSRNAYAMSLGTATTSNLYSPVTATQPALDFFGGDLADPRTTTKTQLSSFALADTLSFYDDRIAVTLGARHQTVKNNSYDYNTHLETDHYDKSAITPVVGLVIKPLKDLSLYANYIEGLQKGKQVTSSTAVNFGQVLSPYKSKQKEIGAKYDAGKIGFGVALFTTTQPSAYEDTVTHIESTNGEQRNRGAEFSVFGAPMRGVRVLGGLTFLRAKLENTNGGLNNGHYAIGVPKTQANIGAEWDIPGVKGLTLNGRAIHTSTQYLDSANLQEVPSWTRYDIGARYATQIGGRVVTLRGAIENLTNKNYWESAGGASNVGYLVLGTPRTYVMSASVDF